MYDGSPPRLSPLWLSASSSACHGLLIITADQRHYLQSPARQKCQRTEAGERSNYWHADASARCCTLDAKYTKELADAKAENDALRDDVAAGRRRLHIKAMICQSVREATTAYRVDNALPRLADTAEQDTHLRRAGHYAKTTGRNRSILMSSADRIYISMGNSCIIVSNTHAL